MSAELPENWPVMSVADANAAIAASDSVLKVVDGEVNGVAMKVYAAAPPTVPSLMQFAQAIHGDKEYLIYEDERVSFNTFAKTVDHFSKILAEQYQVVQGDRVAIIARNYPQWAVAFFAASAVGAIVTPMNSWWSGEELEYGLQDSGAKVAVVGPRILERIKPHLDNLPALENIILMRGDASSANGSDVETMDALLGTTDMWTDLEHIGSQAIELGPDDDATIMYTSGTTGKPKGAIATHRAIVSNFLNSMSCSARMFLRKGLPVPQNDPDSMNVILLSIPFFHATGAFAALVPALVRGDKIITMYKWDATDALKIIERERVTAFGGVPTIAWQILEHPDRDNYDLSSVKVVSYGGAPSAPELVTTIKKRFSSAQPGNGWGMTETCATSTFNIGEDYINRPDSAGAPPAAVELKIVGTDGQTLPAGEVGELWCKGPQNARAYWNKPEASAETFVDGWVVTGDLARIDEEGFLYLVDRAKDMLIRGGENVYCIEVENALYEHPAIIDAAVVGIQHKALGEEVGAVVQVKSDHAVSEADLQAHLRGSLAAFKVPVEIQFETEPLPRNANGKVLKNVLRERFAPRG